MPLANANGIEIAFESLGPDRGPAVLLLAGAGRQLIDWDDVLRAEIAAAGYRVVAADLRDAGLSTHLSEAGKARLSPPWEGGPTADPPYRLADLADDMIGLLDALGIERAHVVGASLGAAVAQWMAVHHPDRVMSLTSIASSTGAATVGLPSIAARRALTRGSGGDAVAETARVLLIEAGPGNLDPEEARERATVAVARSHDPAATGRQLAALWAAGDRTASLAAIDVPTLVIHGSADELVDPSGGRATAEAIPQAVLRIVEGMGHLVTSRHAARVATELLGHFAAAEASVRRRSSRRRSGHTPA